MKESLLYFLSKLNRFNKNIVTSVSKDKAIKKIIKKLVQLAFSWFCSCSWLCFSLSQFKSPIPKCTSQVQIKQHPDINISFPPLVPKNDEYELFAEGEALRTLQQTSCANESKSVITTQTSYCKSVHDQTSETQDSRLLVSMQIRKQQGSSKITADTTLNRLTRSIAFDKADTSGGN